MKAMTRAPRWPRSSGDKPLPRTEGTKVWEYIKANKLQDAASAR